MEEAAVPLLTDARGLLQVVGRPAADNYAKGPKDQQTARPCELFATTICGDESYGE